MCWSSTNSLFTERGASLASIMVGVAIAAILGLSTTQLASHQLAAMRNIEQQEEMISLVNDVKRLLENNADCLANFKGMNPNQMNPLPPLPSLTNLVNADGNPQYEPGQVYGNNRIRLLGMRFGGSMVFFGDRASPTASAAGRSILSLRLEKTGATHGGKEKNIELPILVRTDLNNPGLVVDCSSSMATNNTFWTTSKDDTSLIRYSGNVGIGWAFDPQYRLDVRDGGHFMRFPAQNSSTDYKRGLSVSSEINSSSPNKDKRMVGYFGLKDGTNTVAKTVIGVANGGDQHFESGLRSDVVNVDGGGNRAATFSLFKDSISTDEEYDENLRIRSDAGYWKDSSNYSGLVAHIYGSSGKSAGYTAKGQLAAKVSGTFYGGHFDSKDGVYTETCSTCSVISEMMPVEKRPENGSILCLNRETEKISLCTQDKSSDVIGVAQRDAELVLRMGCEKTLEPQGKNSLHIGILDFEEWEKKAECEKWYPVALSGLSESTNVICHLSDGSPLGYGDLLVSSSQHGYLRALDEGEHVEGVQVVGRVMSLCSKDSDGHIKKRDKIHVWIR